MDYRVIKENDLFLLTDQKGDITVNHPYGLGLYKEDTRFLSEFNLKINGEAPVLLSSSAADNYIAKILLTNPHIEKCGKVVLWRESIEIERTRFIYKDIFYETISFKNYYPKSVIFEATIHMDVDFVDMFIVRGFQSGDVGKRTGQEFTDQGLSFHYKGADHVDRKTVVTWNQPASKVTEKGAITFNIGLNPKEAKEVTFSISPQIGKCIGNVIDPSQALENLKTSYQDWEDTITKIETDDNSFLRLVERGLKDLRVLLTDSGFGKFPVAGLPWFGVPFGRDSIITALQMLPFSPEVAKGTLLTLAEKQGQIVDIWRDEQPGKIMHEIRSGELANTNQIPFTPYYGSIDSTPLFLILLTEYVKWTGDLEIVDELSSNIENALTWINEYGDRDGDGFVEYHQESSKGIANQGWKDSADSIVHRNGDYGEAPIALVEVQGYVFQAKMGIARIYESIGKNKEANVLREEAAKLKERFEQSFWMEDRSFYAIALDRDKKPVGTITSNPGHILFSEILDKGREDAVIQKLVSPKMFSGYGIRTMGDGEAGYNPMSYHDGSVWPHDNSIILLGMSKVNRKSEAIHIMKGLIEASSHFEYDRLPELFCGFDQSVGKPVKYPVACSPQAWAAGTPLTFVQTLMGLFPDSLNKEIQLSPKLLDKMSTFKVSNMSIGSGKLSLIVTRTSNESDYNLKIIENTTGFKVIHQLNRG